MSRFHPAVSIIALGVALSLGARAAPLTTALQEIGCLEGFTGGMLQFSPDGAMILTANGSKTTRNSTDVAQLWDARTLKAIGKPMTHEGLRRAIFDSTCKTLLTVGCVDEGPSRRKVLSGEAKLWDVRTCKLLLPPLRHGELPLSDAALSPDGSIIATCFFEDHTVRLWDAKRGKLTATLAHDQNVLSVQFSPGGVLVTRTQQAISLWDPSKGKLCAVVPDLPDMMNDWHSPVFSADGKRVAIYGFYSFAVYELPSARKVTEIYPELHLDEPIQGLSLNADGTRAATESLAEKIPKEGHVWDIATGKSLLGVSDATYGNPVFSPDGNFVIFDLYGGAAMWDIRSGRSLDLPADLDFSLVAFSPDGKVLAIDSFHHYASIMMLK